jgi:rod shape determining protein RodA
MGAVRLEPTRVQNWAARSVRAVWDAFDVQMLIYALALAIIGLLMAYTNSGDTPLDGGTVFTRGLVWFALAIVAFVAVASFDYSWLKTGAWPLYLVNLGLLAVSLLVGAGTGGVARWVTIFGLQFQFSELAKILMIVVLANWITSRRGARLKNLWTILGAALLAAPPLALVLIQPDLGTSLVFAAILAGTLFMSGASLRWLAVLFGAGVASLPLIWLYVLRDYQQQRLVSFLSPGADPLGAGYHLIQSQIAVGHGGLFGQGLANGTQARLDFLPVQSTDFVFAILSEELGFVGGLLVFGLFVALLWRVLLVGWRAEDPFALAFAGGLASMILFQLLVNVGMVLGIMPITGIPLPFVTHGGASLISIAVGLGILESINLRHARPKW